MNHAIHIISVYPKQTNQLNHQKSLSLFSFPFSFYSPLELYRSLKSAPNTPLLNHHKDVVQRAEAALVDQSKKTDGNVPLYQAALDFAENQFDVCLWHSTINSLATAKQEWGQYAMVQLEKAQVNLKRDTINLEQLWGGQSPDLEEYVLFSFTISSIFVSFPITNIYLLISRSTFSLFRPKSFKQWSTKPNRYTIKRHKS